MATGDDTSHAVGHGRSERVRYGNTDLYVSRICQGTAFRNMPRSADNEVGLRVLKTCLDEGLNFFDTAPGYGGGGAEKLLGKAIAGRRDQAVIANRVINVAVPDGAKEGDESQLARYTRDYVLRATEWSLKRLGTDYLDILSIHLKDGLDAHREGGQQRVDLYMRRFKDTAPTPPDQITDTMDALVKSGKIRYWGLSQHNRQDVDEYLETAAATGKAPIASLQNNYSLLSRGRQTEALFGLIRKAGLGVQTIGPHAAGRLVPGCAAEPGSAHADLLAVLDRVAAELGVPRSQVCVAWVLSHPELTTALAGAESPEHVKDNLAAAALELPAEAMDALNAASERYRQRTQSQAG